MRIKRAALFFSLLLSIGTSLIIDITGSRAESTLVHMYIKPSHTCYLWCAALPYGAPVPPVGLFKNMPQFHLEVTINEVIIGNLQADVDYSVYCYAQLMDTTGTAMTTPIKDTRTDISTKSQDDFSASINGEFGISTTVFPVPLIIIFTHPVQITQTQIEITNGIVSSFTQKSTTEIHIELTPLGAGIVEVTLSSTIKSTSGTTLYTPPKYELTYRGASLSSPKIIAYSRYAIVSVTSSKPVQLFIQHYLKSSVITPPSSVVRAEGKEMQQVDKSASYILNITSLIPQTEYILFISGVEPFGPEIATSIVNTRTSFQTVKDGEKPSEGKQCPRGWTITDGLLLYSQCSDQGVCVDSKCLCNAPYGGAGCSLIIGDKLISANTTHHLIHTRFFVNGEIINGDDDQDAFLQTSLQFAMATASDVTTSDVMIRLWEKIQSGTEQKSLRGLSLSEKRIRRKGILPFVEMSTQDVKKGSLYIHSTIIALKDQSTTMMKTVNDFLSSSAVAKLFQAFDLSVTDVTIDKILIQDNSDPYTCFNNRVDDDETDVDCGGSSCSSRCVSSLKCVIDEDCENTSCFNNKCSGVDWMRVFIIAGIVVVVIVVITIMSIGIAIIRKKASNRTTVSVPLPSSRQDFRSTSYVKRHHNHLHHCHCFLPQIIR